MEYSFSEVSKKLPDLIKNKHTFVITGLSGKLNETAKVIEMEVEAQGMKCRVYTRNRGFGVAVAAFVPYVGWGAIGGVVAHRLSTRNPDFVVGKDIGSNRIHVEFRKK